jgi:predicted RNA-binding protein with TRAM domain
MITPGSIHEVTIVDIGREREGVAKLDGLAIFVSDTQMGDKVKIQIDKVFTRFATGHKV